MSRCFPFPPPGYEKKARTEDVDLLKKEKHKEKKHKKEKKDREKREGNVKREKDKSVEKHKEKKDRKDKHREKRKDREKEKEKEKNKDKSSTSDEKKFVWQYDSYRGENLCQKEKDKDKNRSSNSNEKKSARLVQGYNGDKLSQNCCLAEVTKDSKEFVQELGRRIQDDSRGTGNQLVEKFSSRDWKKEGMVRVVSKDAVTWAEGKEKSKDKRVGDRMFDGQGVQEEARSSGNAVVQNHPGTIQNREEARSSGNAAVQNLPGTIQNRVGGMPRQMENIEKRMEGKERTKEKEGDVERGDKHKDKDREKRSQGKDKDQEKEKKKEKVKQKIVHRDTEVDKPKESNKNNLIGGHNIYLPHLPKESDNGAVAAAAAAAAGKSRKRKELETNGFLHDNDVSPNKFQRTSHSLTENGTKLVPYRTSISSASDRQGLTNNLKVDKNGRKINGVIEAQLSSVSLTKTSLTTAQASQIAEAYVKPPHPDSECLSQVLLVPKVEECLDFDDQEWLFSSSGPQSKKPQMETSAVDETQQVWAEALKMESADVCALPYVIPY
ncbi:uncharacterized protein LOC131151748 [Malania oleifera]|uniref:uncharacterized protein LOC131151748 n=1 Tax=Malania oleifera TaxID=397392 RepID=UPI0025AE2510|nr:uncharacterized protein LOC131151748 [Malania oleifera]